MVRLLGRMAASCCCAALVACSPAGDVVEPTASPSVRQVALPKPALPWDEAFAAGIEVERVQVGSASVLVPKGIQLPEDATIAAATEATIVFADDDPEPIARAVERSCEGEGYVEYAKSGKVTVWVGHGMAVRLETNHGAQVLAWGPESMKDSFTLDP